ncbi:UDP-glycosyltransferase UGT5-like isoform X1 [Culicoides brevitarsis]|uniref:UDP-glycosyltransferase UGT5-like isoform X1 n=1 Tax=Culicoides brevitarsis TaxID=469753 RepID=UPI00307B5470
MSSIKVINFALIFLLIGISRVAPYKILVIFPTGSYSHQRPQQAVSEGLAEAGHHVTILTPNLLKTSNPNITQVDINFTYGFIKEFDLSATIGPYEMLGLMSKIFAKVHDGLMEYEPFASVVKNIKKEKYDAVIVEALPYFPFFVAKEIFDTTLIGLSTLELMPMFHKAMGNLIHPTLHPSFFIDSPTNPSIWDRISMVHYALYELYWEKFDLFPRLDAIIKKYFPETKSKSKDLIRSLDLVLEGITPVLGNVRPVVPNTIRIGFLHIKEPKVLPNPLKSYLDNSKTGVIYLSFGSNVKSAQLKPHIRKTIMDTFRRLKYDILWKYENDTVEGKPNNVRIEKWLPQMDLLAHKNIKVFITQGGGQSMEETIARGVPVVVIPFFADQDANAQKMENLGIGRRLNVNELTVEKLESTIMEVINNPKYKQTVKQLGDRIRDTPMTPVQTAVWWIEYAIRNRGAEHLKYKGTDVPFIEYYLIDVIAVHLVGIFLVLYVLKKLFNMIRGGNSKTTKKMKKQ